jgi:hypothetical protein
MCKGTRVVAIAAIVVIFMTLLALMLGKAYNIVTMYGFSTEMPSDDLLFLVVVGFLISAVIKGLVAND